MIGTMLVGRDDERDRIRQALDAHRLVTLVGPGGVGKTTLATATADDTPVESVFVASLAPVDDADLAGPVAADLGFPNLDEFLDAAADQEWLVVLDNCEHVIDAAAAVVSTMLAATTKLRILATSRERLELPGEVALVIEPLSLDGTPSPAAQLFLAAAQRRGAVAAGPVDGVAGVDEVAEIEELCRRLDGLPLAIELAAARSSSMTPTEMIESLDQSIGLLARRRSPGPERHRSLTAAIDWSHRHLDRDEQELFRSLAVLDGPFTAPMAAAAVDRELGETTELLAALIDRSLILHDSMAGVSWYRMLVTVRAYADDRLGEAGGRPEAEERLTAHLVARADALIAAGLFTDAAAPLELKRSYRLFHRAIERSLAAEDEDRCNRLAAPMWWLSELGHQAESAALLARVLDRFDNDSQPTGVTRAILSDLLLISKGRDEAAEVAKRAVTAGGLAEVLGQRVLGLVAAGQARWTDAIEHYRIAAATAVEVGVTGVALEIRNNAALATARLGDLPAAIGQLEQLLIESEEEELVNAWIGEFLSYVLLRSDHERSAELSRATLRVGERADNGWIIGSARTNLAMVAAIAGDVPEAASEALAGLEAFQSINNRIDITLTFVLIAAIFARLGDEAAAVAVQTTEHSYLDAPVSEFEAELFALLGPLPSRDLTVPPMSVAEMVERLTVIAGDRVGAGDPSEPEPGTEPLVEVRRPAPANRFALAGDVWEITYRGTTILQKASKGLTDIAVLLEQPDREVAAVDLAGAGVVGGGTGELLDDEARRRYQERIRELQDEIEVAEGNNDNHRAESATVELDQLVGQLTEAYGLGGRARTSGDPGEKARTSVTARIRSAVKRLDESDPALGNHLARSIRTGRFCVYSPGDDTAWTVVRTTTQPS